ncbi:hypothetical protein MANES_05G173000v8 [Manihot esculenta]|uniref:EF-hand domain-containing protein n=1 Tax=Manihot esculenta TaxID=3983 RepID=A0A2C9VX44_MANES|nr:hypothetical protein MANES_05G173000v8 [Manihot esculenta]
MTVVNGPMHSTVVNGPRGATRSVNFTEEQLKKIFMEFDENRDNLLSKDEIKKAFNYLGAMIPEFRAIRGIKKADTNGDGMVDLSELNDLISYAFKLGYSVK